MQKKLHRGKLEFWLGRHTKNTEMENERHELQ